MKQQKEKSRTDPIYSCTKNHKIPRNKPNQRIKDLYVGNYRTLMKEIEKNTNGKTLHAHGLEEQILLKR